MSLSPGEREQVLALAARATARDGVAPLNEEALLSVHHGPAHHVLHVAGEEVAGYLQWQPGPGTGQLVVDPAHRRRGIGRTLAAALASEVGSLRLWAFGDLPAARGFAAAHRLSAERTLLMMSASPGVGDPPDPPPGVGLRRFEPADVDALLAVNAAAFAHHPEQGALDAAGLAARMTEPWFDPDGLILAVDDTGLAGFHWTKRHDADTGEVYVLAVAPRAQGRGLGRTLLRAGLAHLAERGCRRVVLYVDSAERGTVRMYVAAGFRVSARDVLYASDSKESHEHR